MSIINRITNLCKEKGIQQQAICKALGITSGTFSTWKKRGTDPDAKYLPRICEILDVPMEYLLTGKEKTNFNSNIISQVNFPKFQRYSWTFPENTEIDKLYNKVCYALEMLHGSLKANALLSAVGLSSDKPAEISETALRWLAYKSNTDIAFFKSEDYQTGISDYKTVDSYAAGAMYYSEDIPRSPEDWAEKRRLYPEMKQWDENYVHIITEMSQRYINQEYFLEITEKFLANSRSQADLMMYIKQGIANYEAEKQSRNEARNAEFNAS